MTAFRRVLGLALAGALPLMSACAPPQVVNSQAEPVAAEHHVSPRIVINGERLRPGAPAVLRIAPQLAGASCYDTAPMPNTLRTPLWVAPVPMPEAPHTGPAPVPMPNACASQPSE